jgi:low-density lipoprotein receptor-related protein 1 (alpha-2-macroglobulin receptor)
MCAKRQCEPGRFRCDNNICIPYTLTCNFVDECGDGSDERPGMCIHHRPQSCSLWEFECSVDGKCINSTFVCDGKPECVDGSDEFGCQTCPFGVCPQLCVAKRHDQFSCECSDGFYLTHKGNSSHCIAQGKQAYLIVASDDRLNQIRKPNDQEFSDLIPASTSVSVKIDSVDYVMDSDSSVHLIWTSRSSKTIQAMFLPAEPNRISRSKRATEISDLVSDSPFP